MDSQNNYMLLPTLSFAFNIENKGLERKGSADKPKVGPSDNIDPCTIESQAESSQRIRSPYVVRSSSTGTTDHGLASMANDIESASRKQHPIDHTDQLLEMQSKKKKKTSLYLSAFDISKQN